MTVPVLRPGQVSLADRNALEPPGAPQAAGGEARPRRETGRWRVFLADDHVTVRLGLKTLIDARPDMEVVGAASDGARAIAAIRSLNETAGGIDIDVVVMDVSMSGMNGIEATSRIRELWPQIPILALTMHEDSSYLRSLLDAGVSGYVLKRSAADELIRAIRVVVAGGRYIDPALSDTLVQALAQTAPRAGLPLRSATSGAALSEREVEVLRLIAQGFTNREIATRLQLSVKTVETYKARSMEKLSLGSRADIVRFAIQQNWFQSTE